MQLETIRACENAPCKTIVAQNSHKTGSNVLDIFKNYFKYFGYG